MSDSSGIKLRPLDEGEAVDIPATKTTIGRGSFLQVADKRVSRNHATLEISDDGKLIVVPIHTNPCFFKTNGIGQAVVLPKDKPKILEHGDVLSLLPDKLFFQVVYTKTLQNSDENDDEKKGRNSSHSQNSGSAGDIKSENSIDNKEEVKTKTVLSAGPKGKEMALPLKKKRVMIPDWMMGASKRVDVSKSAQPKKETIKTPNKQNLVKPPPSSKTKQKMTKKSDSDENDWNEEEEEKDLPSMKKTSRKTSVTRSSSNRGRKTSDDYDDDDDDDDEEKEDKLTKRRPRAVSLKKPNYTDDDFVISDDELDLENISASDVDDDGNRGSRKGKDEDSDFILDEVNSGSDWESNTRKAKGKPKSGHTPSSHRSVRRTPARGKRKRGHDSDSSNEDSDGYVPRLSKRRAAVAAASRMKASKMSEDDDDSEEEEVSEEEMRKPVGKKRNVDVVQKRKSEVEDSEEDEGGKKKKHSTENRSSDKDNGKKKKHSTENRSSDKDNGKKKPKRPCQYGTTCYRKNPKHFEEFSHPEINSEEEGGEHSEHEEKEKKKEPVGRQKRAATLKQQDLTEKLAALHDNSEEDEEVDEDEKEGDGKDDHQAEGKAEESLNGNDNCSKGSDSNFEPDEDDDPRRSKGISENKQKHKASMKV